MPSALATVPIERRQRLLPAFALFAALLIAIGVVAVTGRGIAVLALGALAIAVGVVIALVTWGLARSIRIDRAEARLDGVITETLAASGFAGCSCGHEHDPDELHVTDACAHDGTGTECAHSCESCVRAAHRTPSAADPTS